MFLNNLKKNEKLNRKARLMIANLSFEIRQCCDPVFNSKTLRVTFVTKILVKLLNNVLAHKEDTKPHSVKKLECSTK